MGTLSLFPAPIAGKLFDGSDDEGTPVTIVGLRTMHSDGPLLALFVDADAVLHEAEARLLDFTALAASA